MALEVGPVIPWLRSVFKSRSRMATVVTDGTAMAHRCHTAFENMHGPCLRGCQLVTAMAQGQVNESSGTRLGAIGWPLLALIVRCSRVGFTVHHSSTGVTSIDDPGSIYAEAFFSFLFYILSDSPRNIFVTVYRLSSVVLGVEKLGLGPSHTPSFLLSCTRLSWCSRAKI